MGILRTDKISGLETPTSNDFGPNLLYNGDFSKGTDGWSATNSNHTVSSGQLTITNTGTNGRATSTAFDTVIGEVYEISIHNVSTTGQFRLEIREGNGAGSENNFDSNNSVAGDRTLRFVATETAHSLVVYAIGGSGTTSVYSDITVRKINNIVTGSVHFDGNDHLSIGSAGDFNFLHNGATDWTAEFWAKMPSITRGQVFGTGASSAQIGFSLTLMSVLIIKVINQVFLRCLVEEQQETIDIGEPDSGLSINTWHHIAAVFKSSDKTLALYIDGREVDNDSGTENGTFGSGNYSSSNSSYAFLVGKNVHASTFFTGYISNLRIVAGRRLYTSDFTPPVHALEPIDGTRILCCNNTDSVTAVSNAGIGTAHIGTSSGNPTFVTENPGLSRDFTSGTEFKGVTTFDTQAYFVPPSGTTEQRGRGRVLIAGGNETPPSNVISYVNASTYGKCC